MIFHLFRFCLFWFGFDLVIGLLLNSEGYGGAPWPRGRQRSTGLCELVAFGRVQGLWPLRRKRSLSVAMVTPGPLLRQPLLRYYGYQGAGGRPLLDLDRGHAPRPLGARPATDFDPALWTLSPDWTLDALQAPPFSLLLIFLLICSVLFMVYFFPFFFFIFFLNIYILLLPSWFLLVLLRSIVGRLPDLVTSSSESFSKFDFHYSVGRLLLSTSGSNRAVIAALLSMEPRSRHWIIDWVSNQTVISVEFKSFGANDGCSDEGHPTETSYGMNRDSIGFRQWRLPFNKTANHTDN